MLNPCRGIDEGLKRRINCNQLARSNRIRMERFTFAEISSLHGFFSDRGPPLDTKEGEVINHAEKLSPQEQCATAFGFVTLNPPFWRSSLKSSNEPLTNRALFGSTTTRTLLDSTRMSRLAGPSIRSILYCNPEQPPPMTATLSAPCGRPCRCSNCESFTAALPVTFTKRSFPILY